MTNSYFDLFLGYSAIWVILFLLFVRLALLQKSILKKLESIQKNE